MYGSNSRSPQGPPHGPRDLFTADHILALALTSARASGSGHREGPPSSAPGSAFPNGRPQPTIGPAPVIARAPRPGGKGGIPPYCPRAARRQPNWNAPPGSVARNCQRPGRWVARDLARPRRGPDPDHPRHGFQSGVHRASGSPHRRVRVKPSADGRTGGVFPHALVQPARFRLPPAARTTRAGRRPGAAAAQRLTPPRARGVSRSHSPRRLPRASARGQYGGIPPLPPGRGARAITGAGPIVGWGLPLGKADAGALDGGPSR